MKVLHVIPSVDERSGGPATAILPMCRALQQQGIQVTLISTDAGVRDHPSSKTITADLKGVPALLFPAQLEESFKYSRPLSSWLRTNIHSKGRYFTSEQLCKEVTGEGLNGLHFITYAERKYANIY